MTLKQYISFQKKRKEKLYVWWIRFPESFDFFRESEIVIYVIQNKYAWTKWCTKITLFHKK